MLGTAKWPRPGNCRGTFDDQQLQARVLQQAKDICHSCFQDCCSFDVVCNRQGRGQGLPYAAAGSSGGYTTVQGKCRTFATPMLPICKFRASNPTHGVIVVPQVHVSIIEVCQEPAHTAHRRLSSTRIDPLGPGCPQVNRCASKCGICWYVIAVESSQAYHGSVGCRSTPLTRSVRCTSCFCGYNRNSKPEQGLVRGAGELIRCLCAQITTIILLHVIIQHIKHVCFQLLGGLGSVIQVTVLTFTSSRSG